MAIINLNIQPCPSGSLINVLGDSILLSGSTRFYYLTFTGGTSSGCYFVPDSASPGLEVDAIDTFSVEYADCPTCEAAQVTPTPTPTNTQTPTNTATNTPTPSITASNTATPTPSVTPTNTITPTVTPTQTNTITPTVTPTQTNTSTPAVTPSVTATQTQTPTNTGTAAVTPSVTATKTPTPTITPSVTATNTPTPTLTPTPTPSGYALSAGTEYFMCEWCPGEMPTAEAVPHAVYSNAQGRSVIQENSVALGGFNGLNS